jgi:hypothetical protein
MRKLAVRAISPCIAAVALIAFAQPAAAHERRMVGSYQTAVGWADEPAYAGFPNAVQFILSDAAGQPVVDLGPDELKVEVSFGDQKIGPLAMEPAFRVGAFGEPGDYQADLIPSRPGPYTFHFVGTIKGQSIDEAYTASEQTFAIPENPAEVAFPAKDPSAGELAASIERANSRLEDVEGARTIAMAGVGLGAVALILALASAFRKRAA